MERRGIFFLSNCCLKKRSPHLLYVILIYVGGHSLVSSSKGLFFTLLLENTIVRTVACFLIWKWCMFKQMWNKSYVIEMILICYWFVDNWQKFDNFKLLNKFKQVRVTTKTTNVTYRNTSTQDYIHPFCTWHYVYVHRATVLMIAQ